jgi:8-oxo-dGTP pyrophosphatase MutT (NUDIX family)
MDVIRKWYSRNSISTIHSTLEIRQVYVWIVSKDEMVAVVSKDNEKFQIPGGHPEEQESPLITAQREVSEEIGLDISKYSTNLKFFGYYTINKDNEEYLQIRYFLKMPVNSRDFPLFCNERNGEQRPVSFAKWVRLGNLPEYISWTKESEEYKNVLELI